MKLNLPELPPGYWWSTYDDDWNVIACDAGQEQKQEDRFLRGLLMGYVRDTHVQGVLRTCENGYHGELTEYNYPNAQDAVDALYAMVLLGVFAEYRRERLDVS